MAAISLGSLGTNSVLWILRRGVNWAATPGLAHQMIGAPELCRNVINSWSSLSQLSSCKCLDRTSQLLGRPGNMRWWHHTTHPWPRRLFEIVNVCGGVKTGEETCRRLLSCEQARYLLLLLLVLPSQEPSQITNFRGPGLLYWLYRAVLCGVPTITGRGATLAWGTIKQRVTCNLHWRPKYCGTLPLNMWFIETIFAQIISHMWKRCVKVYSHHCTHLRLVSTGGGQTRGRGWL